MPGMYRHRGAAGDVPPRRAAQAASHQRDPACHANRAAPATVSPHRVRTRGLRLPGTPGRGRASRLRLCGSSHPKVIPDQHAIDAGHAAAPTRWSRPANLAGSSLDQVCHPGVGGASASRPPDPIGSRYSGPPNFGKIRMTSQSGSELNADALPADGPYLADTVRWLERAVIGLNLCPFARAPHVQGKLRLRVSHARDTDALLDDLCGELQSLNALGADECETGLL